MQTISLIAAMERSRGIGQSGKIPWRLPVDLAHFKNLTTGHAIIMGRKTFEAIGKPLPNRRNIVLARNDFSAPGCEVAKSLEEALAKAGDGEVFVIGGGEVYREALARADRIYLTRIDADFPADTYFPDIDQSVWHETERVEGVMDGKNLYPHTFITFEREKNSR